jgi:hypothetical protein
MTNGVTAQTIKIQQGQGITQALKQFADDQNMKKSDGTKISFKEWTATIDLIEEIQQKRQAAKDKPIFTGENNRKDYKNSFVVHTGQEIEFSAEEMESLYKAMGVSSSTQPTPEEVENEEPEEGSAPTNAAVPPRKATTVLIDDLETNDIIDKKIVEHESSTGKDGHKLVEKLENGYFKLDTVNALGNHFERYYDQDGRIIAKADYQKMRKTPELQKWEASIKEQLKGKGLYMGKMNIPISNEDTLRINRGFFGNSFEWTLNGDHIDSAEVYTQYAEILNDILKPKV